MIEKKRAIALGFFDGVHIGHSALLRRALAAAGESGVVPSVITFDTHPAGFVTGRSVPLINSPEDRAGLIQRLFGIDDIIFLHFDYETASMRWDKFVEHLADEFGARRLIAGHDFKFGHRGEGDAGRLREKCREIGLDCDIIPEVKLDGVTSSSTYIRGLIAGGEISRANEFLGHPHVLTDFVRYGYRLGRVIGTPTVNMCFADGVLVPAHGVYATRVTLGGGDAHVGVTNIGTRPTVSDSDRVTAETHILDYQGNLYGKTVRVEFFERLREEQQFSGVEELKERIAQDCARAAKYFEDIRSRRSGRRADIITPGS
ncbi:MAG: riboflavin biosynthesis protein RibF [Oscillospiraceae bacterium]|jgi:riboflavin kinase/FMN adenylyltransferase|nr:riboflavin biosynthesis protein RibF [Oscillospiraceae bacterium]